MGGSSGLVMFATRFVEKLVDSVELTHSYLVMFARNFVKKLVDSVELTHFYVMTIIR